VGVDEKVWFRGKQENQEEIKKNKKIGRKKSLDRQTNYSLSVLDA